MILDKWPGVHIKQMVKKTLANIPKRKNQPFKSAAMMHTALYLIGQQYGTASSRTTIQTINDRQNRPFMKLSFSHQKKKKKIQGVLTTNISAPMLTKRLHYNKNLQVQFHKLNPDKSKLLLQLPTLRKLKNGLV